MAQPSLYPLPFEPYLRPMPWGGRRLEHWLGRSFESDSRIGEAWLLSDHPRHTSLVIGGPLAGVSLRQLMEHRSEELLGRELSRFPLLIKLLDARENLSVQVHPDDASAARWAPGEGGKTEAWLILESDPQAAIYLGLKPGFDKTSLARELTVGAATLCLNRHEPQPGQCYFVPAGTVHALGGGIVVLEVQQTSDATFRLYDWGRVDDQGKPRALHLEAGLACLQERPKNAGLQVLSTMNGGTERLVACDYFKMNRIHLEQRMPLTGPCILVGLAGEARVLHENHQVVLKRGGTILVPASIGVREIEASEQASLVQIEFGFKQD